MSIEILILANLMKNELFMRKSIPYLKQEYFTENPSKRIFSLIQTYLTKYNSQPSKEALRILLDALPNIGEGEHRKCHELIDEIAAHVASTDIEWLIDTTEKWCQERAVFNAIMESIQILDGKVPDKTKGSIPNLLSDALAVSFDPNIGHDYMDDFSDRYDFYHRVEERIPFDLDYFNKITKGGVPKKTLNIILAGTGVGKSLFMCHVAASMLAQNRNVLYITLEMAEERIAERIDANMLNITLEDLALLPKDLFEKRMDRLHERVKGKLVIKEYPTASVHSGHFRALLNELILKKKFKPDIIFIDYINICASSRIKIGANVNTYTYIKTIAEELRGLAVEFNVPIFSATQTTRGGFTNSDPGLEDTAESFGLPATADMMFALIADEALQNLNQLLVKQLKNRYTDPNKNRRFVIGCDKTKMRLYNLEATAQTDIVEDENTNTWGGQPQAVKKFSGLKV